MPGKPRIAQQACTMKITILGRGIYIDSNEILHSRHIIITYSQYLLTIAEIYLRELTNTGPNL